MKNVNLLTSFFHVARQGSFSKAADETGISKAAISKHVKDLETSYGIKLIHRTTRSLVLTEEGKNVYLYCQSLMQQVEDIDLYLAESQQRVRGHIHLKAPPVLDNDILYRVLAQYRNSYPDVTIHVEMADRLGPAKHEKFDLALHIGSIRDCSYICRKLCELDTFVLATPEYWNHYGRPSHPKELTQHLCINYSHCKSKESWVFYKNNERFIAQLNPVMESDSEKLILNMLLASAGVSTVLDILAKPYITSGRLESVLDDYTYPVNLYALYPSRHHQPLRVCKLIDLLLENLSPLHVDCSII